MNQLSEANSPYLLQHAENPVDWYPWENEALQRSKTEDKPIFLSIGYAACHWCHVMAHESFEDPETARIMNENFINIKVDREERPDLDSIYMDAVVAMTGQGGWPMSVFLTPDGKPFFGGTYFPPEPRYNLRSFREILTIIADLWRNDRDQLLKSAVDVTAYIRSIHTPADGATQMTPEILDRAAFNLIQQYDWKFGGWGKAPKFPQPMAVEYLLRRATRGDKMALEVAEHALDAMAKGGMYDIIGGGFARYSTDNNWLVPHFEKMLYDNALLARAYLNAYVITNKIEYRIVCEETLQFILDTMTHPDGGFYSSLDADSDDGEGSYYVWTMDEIRGALNDSQQDIAIFCAAYTVTEPGNFDGANILQRQKTNQALAEQFHLSVDEVKIRLAEMRRAMAELRKERTLPGIDDKVVVAWNALMMIAFAEAGRYLGKPSYTQVARKNAGFILRELYLDQRLHRVWRSGRAGLLAYLEDYAALILGFLALYQADPEPRWFLTAKQLADQMCDLFQDPGGGFFDTAWDHEELITRPKSIQDNAIPSGNSLAANALLTLGAFTGDQKWSGLVDEMWGLVLIPLQQHPVAFSCWLWAMDFDLGPVKEVAIFGEKDHQQTNDLIDIYHNRYRPRAVLAVNHSGSKSDEPALLAERTKIGDIPTAYVCEGFVCQQPVHTPAELDAMLNEA
jgi:uncharacterized protein